MNFRSFRLIVIILTVLLFGSSFSYAKDDQGTNQVILVTINQLSFTDEQIFKEIDGFRRLNQVAGKGAMNINSASSRADYNSYLTIGLGNRGIGNSRLGEFYQNNEITVRESNRTASELYLQQTGNSINDKEAVLFIALKDLLEEEQKFFVRIGSLGEALKNAKKTAMVYGNQDTDKQVRYGPLITMNKKGIASGDVSEATLLKAEDRPYGVKTNYSYLFKKLQEFNRDKTDLIVFDLGDLYRLEEFKEQMDEQYHLQVKRKVYEEIGSFISRIIDAKKDNQLLIVASPMVNQDASRQDYLLAPIWMHDNEAGNLLTSGTTRREGVVANVDIAPTILRYLEVTSLPHDMIGSEIRTIRSDINLEKELSHITAIYQQRQNVLYPYVMWQVAILITAMVAWVVGGNKLNSVAKSLLISLLYLPVYMLITAYWTPSNPTLYFVVMVLISLMLGLISSVLKPVSLFLTIGSITFLLLSLDVLFGAELIKRSFLGYDPIIGARYYGIGNEFMGTYIGATLLFSTSMMQLRKNMFTYFLTALSYGIATIILIYPTLGTNAGGGIAVFLATSITLLNLIGLKWNKRNIAFVSIALFTLLFSVLLLNYLVPVEEQSHIGKALGQLFNGNLEYIIQTVYRKLSMNWKLMKVSSWGKVMITALLAIGILFLKDTIKRMKQNNKYTFVGFNGIVIGAIISFFVNDSGVVAAATMIMYAVVPILYLALTEQQEPD